MTDAMGQRLILPATYVAFGSFLILLTAGGIYNVAVDYLLVVLAAGLSLLGSKMVLENSTGIHKAHRAAMMMIFAICASLLISLALWYVKSWLWVMPAMIDPAPLPTTIP